MDDFFSIQRSSKTRRIRRPNNLLIPKIWLKGNKASEIGKISLQLGPQLQ
jgi:hypothetical protein